MPRYKVIAEARYETAIEAEDKETAIKQIMGRLDNFDKRNPAITASHLLRWLAELVPEEG